MYSHYVVIEVSPEEFNQLAHLVKAYEDTPMVTNGHLYGNVCLCQIRNVEAMANTYVRHQDRLSWTLVSGYKAPWELPHNICRPLHSTRPRPTRQKKVQGDTSATYYLIFPGYGVVIIYTNYF